jgi:hypothetical protein
MIKIICKTGFNEAYTFYSGLTKKESTFFTAIFKPLFASYEPLVSGKVSAVINSVLIKSVFL